LVHQLEDDSLFEQPPSLGEILKRSHIAICQAIQLERASQTWNVVHALEVFRQFVEMRGVQSEDAPWPNFAELMSEISSESTDGRGTYPTLRDNFAKITGYFAVGKQVLDQIAPALYSAYTLERIHQTREAIRITGAVINRELGN
jgi:hypothetical protein